MNAYSETPFTGLTVCNVMTENWIYACCHFWQYVSESHLGYPIAEPTNPISSNNVKIRPCSLFLVHNPQKAHIHTLGDVCLQYQENPPMDFMIYSRNENEDIQGDAITLGRNSVGGRRDKNGRLWSSANQNIWEESPRPYLWKNKQNLSVNFFLGAELICGYDCSGAWCLNVVAANELRL